MERVFAFADDLDVIDMRRVADEQFQHRIDLIIAAGRPLVTLDQPWRGRRSRR